jgi:hypothetical protein
MIFAPKFDVLAVWNILDKHPVLTPISKIWHDYLLLEIPM